MIAELNAAKGALEAALDRYSTILSTIVNLYDSGALSQAIHHVISPEIEAITTYETTLKRTKAVISRAHNSNRSLAPINALPSDILTQIFELLVDSQPPYCTVQNRYDTLEIFFRHPDVLTRVCSRWRRVAIDSRSLWTSIALAPLDRTSRPLSREDDLRAYAKMLIVRANLFLSRAGQSPLDVYFDGNAFPHHETQSKLEELCNATAPRARRLEFGSSSFNRIDFHFFRLCMHVCTPGTLRQLVILGGSRMSDDPSHFIDGGAESMDSLRWLLDVPQPELEQVLLPIDVMQLKGRYFRWESQAYHGLVELRLTKSGLYSETRVPITTTDIAHILGVSPRLRLLHFGLQIQGPHLVYRPAPLPELEVLNLAPMDPNQCELILQLIAPGPKPLQLLMKILSSEDHAMPVFSHDSMEFFFRSNVTELKLSQANNGDPRRLPGLLSFLPLPTLRVLALDKFTLDLDGGSPEDRDYPQVTSLVCSQLEILQFSFCTLDLDDLVWVSKALPISRIQVFAGWLVSAGGDEIDGTDEVQDTLIEVFPKIYPKPVTRHDLVKRWDKWTAFD